MNSESKLVTEVNLVSLIFFGIYEGKLFVQITTRDNEIAYEAETPVSENPTPIELAHKIAELFPDSFKESGIKRASITSLEWDGQKVAKSGGKEIIECKTITDIFPKFGGFVLSYLFENR